MIRALSPEEETVQFKGKIEKEVEFSECYRVNTLDSNPDSELLRIRPCPKAVPEAWE
ncbi:hypothetical protein MDA_GLEAN10008500 [Myotis davidii]|uniref:Uncharacterized protein n=1 Tax=Myotis davidii TaxID=225400 RepID=L5MC10_MYODS|nr:hypothetical protein MDA_GLEAN10008500 [Myotis davidii]